MSESLALAQIGADSGCSLDVLKESIELRFPWFRVEKATPLTNVAEAYCPQRDQYHSTRILALLEKKIESFPASRILGVASVDLFVPGMNFVFGEARLPGRVGLISTHRLKPQSPPENPLLHERVNKEAVHEIGHMLGLSHCASLMCVMHFSERIEDTDRKQDKFCENCRCKLEELRRG
jgi:archaemetzincin